MNVNFKTFVTERFDLMSKIFLICSTAVYKLSSNKYKKISCQDTSFTDTLKIINPESPIACGHDIKATVLWVFFWASSQTGYWTYALRTVGNFSRKYYYFYRRFGTRLTFFPAKCSLFEKELRCFNGSTYWKNNLHLQRKLWNSFRASVRPRGRAAGRVFKTELSNFWCIKKLFASN